jgi:RNA polymerase sigma-70 factor (ECF subfamily)
MNGDPLDSLAVAAEKGDEEACRQLVESQSRALMAMAYRYTGDWHEARDLCQETWLKVLSSLHRRDHARPLLPWLRAIHRNTCLTHLRRRRVRPQGAVDDDAELESLLDPNAADPLQEVARTDTLRRVRRAMEQLSERQREVFALVALEDLDHASAAGILGMTPATLRTTLHFARRRIAKLLDDEEERT